MTCCRLLKECEFKIKCARSSFQECLMQFYARRTFVISNKNTSPRYCMPQSRNDVSPPLRLLFNPLRIYIRTEGIMYSLIL